MTDKKYQENGEDRQDKPDGPWTPYTGPETCGACGAFIQTGINPYRCTRCNYPRCHDCGS